MTEPLAPLSDEQLTLLKLCFDESEFGVVSVSGAPASGSELMPPIGTASGGFPVTFVPFSAYNFVREKNEHIALSILDADLNTYAIFLERSIMRRIHEDVHDAFVTVSGQLVGMNVPLQRLMQPIESANKRLQRAIEGLTDIETNLDKTLSEVRIYEMQSNFYTTYLKMMLAYQSAQKIYANLEKTQREMIPVVKVGALYVIGHLLPQQDELSKSKSHDSDSNHDALLLELCQHLHRMRLLKETMPPTKCIEHKTTDEFVELEKEIDQLMQDCTKAALSGMATALLDAYSEYVMADVSSTPERLRRFSALLQMYFDLHEENEFSLVYRDVVVRPIIEGVLSWTAVGEARRSLPRAIDLLTSLTTTLEENVLPLVPLLASTFAPRIMPISDIIWPAVADTIQKRMFYLFITGFADVFHKYYTSANNVLALLERSCNDVEEFWHLRNSPDTSLWMRKWNLDVYHSLCSSQLKERFEKASKTPLKSSSDEQFQFELFAELRNILEWLFSGNVFLFPILPKFLKDAALLVQNTAGVALNSINNENTDDNNTDAKYLKLYELLSDLLTVRDYLSGSFIATVCCALRETNPCKGIEDVCKYIVDSVKGYEEKVITVIQGIIVSTTFQHLQIATNMSTRGAPTVVPTIANVLISDAVNTLPRLHNVAVQSNFKLISKTEVMRITAEAISTILVPQYQVLVQDTLKGAWRRITALSKLKRSGAATSSSQNELTDFDKLVLQLNLDVDAFLLECEKFVSEDINNARKIFDPLARRAEWIIKVKPSSSGQGEVEPPPVWGIETKD